jgi:hypothetical protein
LTLICNLDQRAEAAYYSKKDGVKRMARADLVSMAPLTTRAMMSVKLEGFATLSRYTTAASTKPPFCIKCTAVGPPTVFRLRAREAKADHSFDPGLIADGDGEDSDADEGIASPQ